MDTMQRIVGVRMTVAEVHKLDELASITDRTRSSVLRRLLALATVGETPDVMLGG